MRIRLNLAALFLVLVTAMSAQKLPRKALDYSCNLPGGKTISLSDYRGKPVVLAFIFTYCPHCQKAVGHLIRNQAEFGPRGLQVVACAVDKGVEAALPGFLKNFKPNFPVGYKVDNGQSMLDFMQHPMAKVPYMPLMTFIDRQGMIRSQVEGDELEAMGDKEGPYLRKQIEAILGATPAKKSTTAK